MTVPLRLPSCGTRPQVRREGGPFVFRGRSPSCFRWSLFDYKKQSTAIHERQVGVDTEVRLRCMSLGVKKVKIVGATLLNAESLSRRIESNGSRLLRMESADVDRELVVDEHPYVVVAIELKRLAAAVGEARMELGRETEIVDFPVVRGAGVAPADVVDGEEVVALEPEKTVPLRRKPHVDEIRLIHARRVAIPLIEVRLGRGLCTERASRRRGRVPFFALRSVERLLTDVDRHSHEPSRDVIAVERSFEIGVTTGIASSLEISNHSQKNVSAVLGAVARTSCTPAGIDSVG